MMASPENLFKGMTLTKPLKVPEELFLVRKSENEFENFGSDSRIFSAPEIGRRQRVAVRSDRFEHLRVDGGVRLVAVHHPAHEPRPVHRPRHDPRASG